jgi:FkbM family methyltransferase
MTKSTFISYSQYEEDVILFTLLGDCNKGRYVDVGANDPIIESTTYWAYVAGWRGVLIEPIEIHCQSAKRYRPRDWIFNVGIGSEIATNKLYIPNHLTDTRSRFMPVSSSVPTSIEGQSFETQLLTLNTILRICNFTNIDLLCIDVEGMEIEVIISNDWDRFRPDVIVIEVISPNSNSRTKEIEFALGHYSYNMIYFDGINGYFVSNENIDKYSSRIDKIKRDLNGRIINPVNYKTRHEIFISKGY